MSQCMSPGNTCGLHRSYGFHTVRPWWARSPQPCAGAGRWEGPLCAAPLLSGGRWGAAERASSVLQAAPLCAHELGGEPVRQELQGSALWLLPAALFLPPYI